MTAVVVDASVAVKWVTEESDSANAVLLLGYRERHAPDHWLGEATTAIWAKVSRGDLTAAEGEERMQSLLRSPVIGFPISRLIPRAFAISLACSVTIYDSLYVALAETLDMPLITADAVLIRRLKNSTDHARRIVPISTLT